MKTIRTILIVITVSLTVPIAVLAQKPFTVGIVKDASGNEFEALSNEVKSEIEALLSARDGVRFKELNAQWKPGKVDENIQAFLNDAEVDIVLTLGLLSSEAAARLNDYRKPVIAGTILDRTFQALPLQPDNSSGISNFSYIESWVRFKSDMLEFARMFQISHLTVVVPKPLYEEFKDIKGFLTEDALPFELSFVTAEEGGDPFSKMPENTDAAMLFPLVQHKRKEIQAFFTELNQSGIPSLALAGTDYLEQGATLTLTPHLSFQQMARQVALCVLKVSEGTNLMDIPVAMDGMNDKVARTPVINMQSLRQMNKFLQWWAMANAIVMNVAEMPGEELSLRQAIARALENNLQGKIADQDLLIAQKDVRIARSNVLPQIEVSGSGVQLSRNLVEASMGQRGEFTITGSASLKQVIWSEAAFANIAIKKLAAETARQYNRQTMLNIVSDVSKAYISLLFAKSKLQISNDNVYATLQNLEMAKAKEKSGEGGISDVNRWTSELNLNKMTLNDAQAKYRAAMYQLNQLLNYPIANNIATADSINVDGTVVPDHDLLSLFFESPELTEKYADFLIEGMQNWSPELQQLHTAGSMVDRKRAMNIRQMFIPELALFGGADQAFVRDGTISNPQLPIPPPPDDITWNIGLRLSLPIFTGGRKSTEVKRSAIEQDKITWQKEELLGTLEQGIRANVQLLKASYRELDLSQNAAQAAADNLQVVRDAYSQGMATVVQLIDAQNMMVKTQLMAQSSYYQYVLDHIHTQRLYGRFIFLEDEEEQNAYVQELREKSPSEIIGAGSPAPPKGERKKQLR
ncbi:Outer membrane protein TolC [Saccharicrinis carchari]|uniref:Outer membrane protein TolC n=1 Tax=Saccharicrinis carchari TaxID=1168039 RepID=A0A521AWP9_SACCC|nr:TolC family protein [Saccharicrinis carchari]SMO39214.1 Outer membrane protein TolC [Saccharicrinis carchari]